MLGPSKIHAAILEPEDEEEPSTKICIPKKFESKSCKTGNLLWKGCNKMENGACEASWQSSGGNVPKTFTWKIVYLSFIINSMGIKFAIARAAVWDNEKNPRVILKARVLWIDLKVFK